jgi:3-hydroxyacyl-CoA dehydrogenase
LPAQPAAVKKVGLVGAGLMAGGIAMNFAERGIPVVMLDREQKFLDQASALQQIGRADRRVSRGVAVARLPPAPAAQLYARHTQSAHASARPTAQPTRRLRT